MKKIIIFILLLTFSFFSFGQGQKLESFNITPNATVAMASGNYLVTAGDIYSLSFLAGQTPVNYTMTVDSTYKLRIANLGILDVSNTDFITLKKKVEEIVTKNYPMSGVQFNLVSPGSFTIIVKGEVPYTVETSAWALTRLSSVVSQYKNNYASIRNVQIKSENGKVKTYDLYKSQRYGDFSQDPYLRPGDVITLSPIEKSVIINGAVKRPGTYELLKGEGLKELVELYGDGFAPMADSNRIELVRTSNPNSKTGEKIILTQEDIDSNFELLPYDNITIRTYNDLRPVFFLEGAIQGGNTSTGTDFTAVNKISFNAGEKYSDFAKNNRNYFGANADLSRAYVIRDSEVIPINLYDIIYNNAVCDVEIKANDRLTVPSKTLTVAVMGSVRAPGRYPYLPGKDWQYYINLAGGFIQERNSFDSVKIVDADGNKLTKEDEITPETTITAKTNDFLYYFSTYAPVITTTMTIIMTGISLFAAFGVGK